MDFVNPPTQDSRIINFGEMTEASPHKKSHTKMCQIESNTFFFEVFEVTKN